MIDIQSPNLIIVLLVCLSISFITSLSGIRFIDKVATNDFIKCLSYTVYLDVLLFTHLWQIKLFYLSI